MNNWKLTSSVLCTVAMLMVACTPNNHAVSLQEILPPPWNSKFETEHPLVGKIWQTSQNRFVQLEQIREIIRDADFIMLGEKHDNIDHHRIQSKLIQIAFEGGRVSPVAFEMITIDQTNQLEKYQKDHPGDAAQLGQDLRWKKSGWPAWSMYYPVAQAAMVAGAPLIAASQPRGQLRKMIKQGVESVLGSDTYKRLRLNTEIPSSILETKREEIRQSHCNQLPERMVDPMVQVQHAKDAIMAHTLINSDLKHGGNGVVLIAGLGHVRHDYGVPWHLKRAAPDKSILTIGIVEVDPTITDPRDYGADSETNNLPFDLIWFTPRSDNSNPCERFAKQLKKLGKAK